MVFPRPAQHCFAYAELLFAGNIMMETQQTAIEPEQDPIGLFRRQLRHWVQLVVFVLTLAVGIQFAVYVFQAGGTTALTVQRPPGVEGFLPIGALMGFKLFLTTGTWDPVHPAAMVILGFAVLISFGLRKSFCGWFCPVGTLSEWIDRKSVV